MIRKLKYIDKEEAIKHLTELGIITDTDFGVEYCEGVHTVIHLPKFQKIKGVYEGEELIEPPVFIEGHHVDVVTENDFKCDFGVFEIFPKNDLHVLS